MVDRKSTHWGAWSLSLLLLFSCADTNSFDLLVDQARLRWARAVCLEPKYSEVELVRTISECGNSTYAWGCYGSVTGLLRVSRSTPLDQRLKVLTHEMGHSLRPGSHLETPTGLMFQHPDQVPNRITADDIAYICKEYDCPCRNPEKSP